MFVVSDSNKEYKVSFKHTTLGKKRGERRVTLCTISEKDHDDLKEVSKGLSVCNPIDNYDKNVGRKIALSHALTYFDDKDFRALVWDIYFSKRGRVS